MTHLDEGTIHAWLDGALDEARAAEVSKHAASCTQCGAAVAEARGFIAGASRILTSLDDVPAGVTPVPLTADASTRAPTGAPARPPRRSWQAAPWVTGIAAALILAIGVKEWRDRPSARAAYVPVPGSAADSLVAAETLRLDQRLVDSALRGPRPRVLEPVKAMPNASPTAPVVRARAEVAAAGGAGAGNAGARADAAGDLAGKAGGDLKKTAAADAPQLPVAAPAVAAAGALALESAARPRPEQQLAGCNRLESTAPPAAAAQAKVALSERPPERAARLAPVRVGGAAAPTAADFAIPSILRLDTAASASGRHSVVSAATGEAVGTWTAIGGDTVRLVLVYAGVQTLSSANRVACPPARERP